MNHRRIQQMMAALRGGGITPADLANLHIWCAADELVGFADGDPVGTWTDQSGGGRDLITVSTSYRPTYKASQVNGLPGLLFDGIDDRMEVSFPSIPAGPYDFFLVVNDTTAEDSRHVFYNSYTSLGPGLYTNPTTTPDSYVVYSGSATYSPETPLVKNQPVILTTQHDIGSTNFWLNGVLKLSATSSPPACSGLKIGSSYAGVLRFAGLMCEFIMVRGVTATERGGIDDYLATKYGITI